MQAFYTCFMKFCLTLNNYKLISYLARHFLISRNFFVAPQIIRIPERFALFILMFLHVVKFPRHFCASTNGVSFSTLVHQKMSARISGHSIIYDSSSSYCSIARSGWHLPLCGVAVVSQVLCTSTTLNKRNTVSVQYPYRYVGSE